MGIQFTSEHERFWSKVDIRSTDECWEWKRSRQSYGYGLFWNKERKLWDRAHRIAWKMTHGDIPDGLVVRHKVCDNPSCCNPAHLAIGTHADNVADKVEKGRHPRGEGDSKAILTAAEVRDIRNLYASGSLYQYQIARVYGVGKGCIRDILAGVNWSEGVSDESSDRNCWSRDYANGPLYKVRCGSSSNRRQ